MPAYGYAPRTPEQDYCASILHSDGARQFAHVRTNMGRKVAFAIVARSYPGCVIENFRDEKHMSTHEREQCRSA